MKSWNACQREIHWRRRGLSFFGYPTAHLQRNLFHEWDTNRIGSENYVVAALFYTKAVHNTITGLHVSFGSLCFSHDGFQFSVRTSTKDPCDVWKYKVVPSSVIRAWPAMILHLVKAVVPLQRQRWIPKHLIDLVCRKVRPLDWRA